MTEPRYIGPFRVGELINNQYKVIRLLGQGGHAHVYECHDDVLDSDVAIKVIAATAGRGQELIKRARAEAQVMFRLSHPNVVKVYSAIIIDNSMLGIVMEKLEGLTLRMMLVALGQLTVFEALNLVRQIAVGVGAAHRLNVVHRDIKPENVFVLPPDNSVKVLDFGIAKFVGHGLQTTNKDRLQGTPLYMSPEHLTLGEVTPRSDIYQLGIVLFELITGINPCLVGQEFRDAQQIGLHQLRHAAPALSTITEGISLGLDKLVQCAAAKDPKQRFNSMDDMVVALDQAIEERRRSYPKEVARVRFIDEAMIRGAVERAKGAEPVARRPPLAPAIETGPRSNEQDSPATPTSAAILAAPQGQARSLAVVSGAPPRMQRRRQPLSVWLVAVPVLLGGVAGTGISLLWRLDNLETRANRAAASASNLAVPAITATPSVGDVAKPEEADATTVVATSLSPTIATVPMAPADGLPSRQRKAAAAKKPSGAAMRVDGLPYKPNLLERASSDGRENTGTLPPTFNADLERKLKAAGRMQPSTRKIHQCDDATQ